jgi:hypothetical protein
VVLHGCKPAMLLDEVMRACSQHAGGMRRPDRT